MIDIKPAVCPPRPEADKAMILAAATVVAGKLGVDPHAIANHYRRNMDGFELAKELDKYANWDATREDVVALDEVNDLVDQAERAAIQAWAEEHNPQPPFPIGTRITEGVITGLYEYDAATYRVKEDGCTNATRSRLIKFENAREAVTQPATAAQATGHD